MLFWIAIVSGTILLLLIILWVIGLTSPETYTAHIELFMKAPPDAIWDAMQDVEKHPVGAGMTRSVNRRSDEDGQPAWEENLGSSRFTVREVASVANTSFRRICRDSVIPMTAEIEMTLEQVQGGTKINAVNHTTVRNGTWHVPMIRLVMRWTDALERGLKDYFRQIGRTLGTEPRFHARPGKASIASGR